MKLKSTLYMEEMQTIVRINNNKNLVIVLLTSVRHNPGPGTYEPKNTLSTVGKYFVSTIKNTGGA